MPNSVIISTGCYIPSEIIPNSHFLNTAFYSENGDRLEKPNPEIIDTLYNITGIRERRYAGSAPTTTDIAYEAAAEAMDGIDMERLDYIIVAQNFGDTRADNIRTEMVPTIASRVKHRLKIKNPYTVAYDIPFGCPGWVQGMIMADDYIRSGDAQRALVIGAEILSRVSDPHDVDSMIFADGAGAAVVEASDENGGILQRLFKLYGVKTIPEDIMPMIIHWTGNSSVATVPTLLDLLLKGRLDDQRLFSGDIVVFASVGAGMNINAMVYRMP